MLSDATPVHYWSAHAIAAAIKSGQMRSVDVTRGFLDRIQQAPALGAFSVVFEASAMAQAAAADQLQATGAPLRPLHGVPVAVKDSVQIAGTTAQAGSLTRSGFVSDTSSTIADRLIAEGMVILGKTNMTEYAFGLSGQNPTVGTARNPWDAVEVRSPGGSSSGSGVAVAAGLAPIAIGGDTGGSVRAPALLNGIVGFKPSSGVIGRGGCVPLSDTLDVLGPICRSVDDAHVLTALMAGPDARDALTGRALTGRAYTGRADIPTTEAWHQPLSGKAATYLVVDAAAWPGQLAPDVQLKWDALIDRLTQAGLDLQAWHPPQDFDLKSLSQDNSIILSYEGFQYYGALAQNPAESFWEVVRQRILRGGLISPDVYHAALERRQRVMANFTAMMPAGAVLLHPGCRSGARPLDAADDVHAHLGDWLRAANFLGAPALTLPCGFDDEDMPIGLQLMAPASCDLQVLAAGQQLEQVIGPLRRHPDLRSWGL